MYFFHSSHFSCLKVYFDPSGMNECTGQNGFYNAFSERPCSLVLFEHYGYLRSYFNISTFCSIHFLMTPLFHYSRSIHKTRVLSTYLADQ